MMLSVAHTSRTRIVIADDVPPETIRVIETSARARQIEVVVVNRDALKEAMNQSTACAVFANPTFDGVVWDPSDVSASAHDCGALTVAVADPAACTVICPPGQYAADISVAAGQQLGIPLSFGWPHVGLLAVS